MSEWKKSRKFVAAVLLITMLFSQSASVWAVDTSVGSVSANTLSDDIETNEKNDVSSPEEATTQADSASAGDFSSGKDHTVESEDSISDNTTSPSDDSQRTDAVLTNSITQTVSENIVEETDESVSNNSVSANTVSANTVSTFRLAAPLVQPVAGGGQPLTTLDENSVYWIYSVADNGGGTYAPTKIAFCGIMETPRELSPVTFRLRIPFIMVSLTTLRNIIDDIQKAHGNLKQQTVPAVNIICKMVILMPMPQLILTQTML